MEELHATVGSCALGWWKDFVECTGCAPRGAPHAAVDGEDGAPRLTRDGGARGGAVAAEVGLRGKSVLDVRVDAQEGRLVLRVVEQYLLPPPTPVSPSTILVAVSSPRLGPR